MTYRISRLAVTGILAVVAMSYHQTVVASGLEPAGFQTQSEKPKPKLMTAPGIRQPFSEADVHFVSGMIPHHAQAVLIASWASTHGASDSMKLLCERIIVSQRDEIRWMQNWLGERGQEVPDEKATHHKMKMGDHVHEMLMPGMLTEEELKQLDKSRGKDFDRLFLTFMIKHHEGAIRMVEELFDSYGAAQDDSLYQFASDVFADQTAEITAMSKMLAAIK
jgi:uncharacterized protein (DUF305 family)